MNKTAVHRNTTDTIKVCSDFLCRVRVSVVCVWGVCGVCECMCGACVWCVCECVVCVSGVYVSVCGVWGVCVWGVCVVCVCVCVCVCIASDEMYLLAAVCDLFCSKLTVCYSYNSWFSSEVI